MRNGGKSGVSVFTCVIVGHHNILCNMSNKSGMLCKRMEYITYYLFYIYVISVFPGLVRKARIIIQIARSSYHSRGARDSKIGKKWPESSRILDYILC